MKSQTKILGILLIGLLGTITYLMYVSGTINGFSLVSVASSTDINLVTIFLTGLLTGGLTCLAVQGGLLATTIANIEEQKLITHTKSSGNALPIMAFLASKLVAYSVLGFLLGALGSVVQFSLAFKAGMQIVISIYMILTALNILNVHPLFRYVVLQPPKFLTRYIRKQSKSASYLSPILLGALTVFIPCGTTQAMMALSIGSGSPWIGMLILAAFVLGTSPLFFVLGYFATKLSDSLHGYFMKTAAIALIILGFINLNSALALAGSPVTFETLVNNNNASIQPSTALSDVTIRISNSGYTPTSFAVKAGSTVTVHLINETGGGCVQAFTIPKLKLQKIVPVGSSDTVSFTAPSEKGVLPFMCSMGMYKGTIQII